MSELNTGWKLALRLSFGLAICVILAGTHWAMYQQGKVKGYAQASKDRATQTYQATKQTVTNTYIYQPRRSFSLLSIGPWALLSKESAATVPVVTQTVSVPAATVPVVTQTVSVPAASTPKKR